MHWLDHVELARPAVPVELLRVAMPRCPDAQEWADELSEALAWAKIRQPSEVAMFLAQVGHESSDLTSLEEDLNYSAKRLTEVWPSRYPTLEAAAPYARNPEALANHTYGSRLGNTQPGDGWKFRGRGPIQLTGRENYTRCASGTDLPLLEYPDRLASMPKYGAQAAAWYWLDRVTQGGDIRQVTREINGGLNGLADREERLNRILAWMQKSASGKDSA